MPSRVASRRDPPAASGPAGSGETARLEIVTATETSLEVEVLKGAGRSE